MKTAVAFVSDFTNRTGGNSHNSQTGLRFSHTPSSHPCLQ